MSDDHSPEEYVLAGYSSPFDVGFALPYFSTHPRANTWYTASCSIPGDHQGTITDFEVAEIDQLQFIESDRLVQVSAGSPWVDVFLWNGVPLVGTPVQIIEVLGDISGLVRSHSPLAILDLAIAGNVDDLNDLIECGRASIVSKLGAHAGDRWLRNHIVKEHLMLLLRRKMQLQKVNSVTFDQLNRIEVAKSAGALSIEFPDDILVLIDAIGSQETIEAELHDFGERIGHGLSVNWASRSEDRGVNRKQLNPESEFDEIENLRRLANHDSLTGLKNRFFFNQEANRQIEELKSGGVFAVFLIDIDQFKGVNDRFGHQGGDELLKQAAIRITRSCDVEESIIARFGGDEFIVGCQFSDTQKAYEAATTLLAMTSQPYTINGEKIPIGVKVGLATIPPHVRSLDELIARADKALFKAKDTAADRPVIFDEKLENEIRDREELRTELIDAIAAEELSLSFQPIVNLDSTQIVSFEALVRWNHPRLGTISPERFIPIAEERGFVSRIDHWVLSEAILACSKWPKEISVSVNLSPMTIEDEATVELIRSCVSRASLNPSRLGVEITESALLLGRASVRNNLKALDDMGVSVILDDFGTGYSSMGLIMQLPLSSIKIDRSIVSGALIDGKGAAVIRAAAALAQDRGAALNAEGLETMEQVSMVRNAGCSLGQGFYFSRPLDIDMATSLVAEQKRLKQKRA